MEFGKLVSHGQTFYLTLDPGMLCNTSGKKPRTYYVATAVDSYPMAFYFLCRELCRPRTAVGVLRWHEAHERLLGTIPYDDFVERVRGVKTALFQLVLSAEKACSQQLAEVQLRKCMTPAPNATPRVFLRDTLIQCRDQSCQTPMASDPRSLLNNRILQVGHGKARRQLCGVDSNVGATTLLRRQILRSRVPDW